MKSILISIKPKYVAEILNGRKSIEVRKSCPKCELPCEVYIYCTENDGCMTKGTTPNGAFYPYFPKGHSSFNGKVVARFTLNKVEELINPLYPKGSYVTKTTTYEKFLAESCLTEEELDKYLPRPSRGYAWHIDDLVIFDEPKELEEFEFPNPSGVRYIGQRAIKGLPSKKRPPQSWCYAEAEE